MSLLRAGWRILAVPIALLASLGPGLAQPAPDPRVADLVQAGRLRVGLFASQFIKDTASGALRSVRVDLSTALAARLGVRAELIEHRTPPDAIACLKTGACDIVFLPRDERAASIGEFSNPILLSEFTLLVPAGSAIHSLGDADKAGIRIAAVRSHASTATLSGLVKHARVLDGENETAAFEIMRSGNADIFASTRQYLLRVAKGLPGSQVLGSAYGANVNRIVVPKGKTGWLTAVNEFVEAAKASGMVQAAIDRDGTFAFQVPPPGDPQSSGKSQ